MAHRDTAADLREVVAARAATVVVFPVARPAEVRVSVVDTTVVEHRAVSVVDTTVVEHRAVSVADTTAVGYWVVSAVDTTGECRAVAPEECLAEVQVAGAA